MKKKRHLQPGDKISRLTVLAFDHTGKHWRSYYLFKCDCGKRKVILGSGVVSGNTKSCGCLSYEIKHSKRLPNSKGVINHLILQYKRHARNRNLEFALTYNVFSKLISKNCYYCGLPPSNVKRTKNCKEGFIYSGVDRLDSSLGYYLENCVPACVICNRAKNDLSVAEFQEWVSRLNAMAEQWGLMSVRLE